MRRSWWLFVLGVLIFGMLAGFRPDVLETIGVLALLGLWEFVKILFVVLCLAPLLYLAGLLFGAGFRTGRK